jgi:hypothetical protein
MNDIFDVHLYALVRVKISGVSAETQAAAIDGAMKAVSLDQVFNGSFQTTRANAGNGIITAVEYADDIPYALVDVRGDAEYRLTRAFRAGKDGAWVTEDRN